MTRRIDQPRPGYFKLALVKGGPMIGAELRHQPASDPETSEPLDRSPLWETWIDGKLVRDPSPDPTAAGVWRVWLHGTEISRAEYQCLVKTAEWAATYAPTEPEANPKQRIVLRDLHPLRFMPRRKT